MNSQGSTISNPSGLYLALLILLVARSGLAPDIVSQYATLFASAILLTAMLPRFHRLWIPKQIWWLVGFATIFFSSTFLAGDLVKASQAFGICLMWIIVFIFGANLSLNQWNRFLVIFVFIALVQTCIAFGETFVQSDLIRSSIASDAAGVYSVRQNLISALIPNRAQGTIGYPLPFSHFIAVGLVVTLASGVIRSWKFRIPIVIVFVLALFMSGSRSSLVAAAVSLVVLAYIAADSAKINLRVLAILTLLPLLTIVAWDLLSRESTSGDYSFIHRFGVVSSLPEILGVGLRQMLIGSGYNSHEALFQQGIVPGVETFAVDNAFVSIIIASGLLGFFSFVGLLVASTWKSGKLTKVLFPLTVVFGFSYDFVYWHLLMFVTLLFIGQSFAVTRESHAGMNGIPKDSAGFVFSKKRP